MNVIWTFIWVYTEIRFPCLCNLALEIFPIELGSRNFLGVIVSIGIYIMKFLTNFLIVAKTNEKWSNNGKIYGTLVFLSNRFYYLKNNNHYINKTWN